MKREDIEIDFDLFKANDESAFEEDSAEGTIANNLSEYCEKSGFDDAGISDFIKKIRDINDGKITPAKTAFEGINNYIEKCGWSIIASDPKRLTTVVGFLLENVAVKTIIMVDPLSLGIIIRIILPILCSKKTSIVVTEKLRKINASLKKGCFYFDDDMEIMYRNYYPIDGEAFNEKIFESMFIDSLLAVDMNYEDISNIIFGNTPDETMN